ncbi:MAG: hypothetical protein WAT93_01035 [Pontixanthobacter sp.]
MTDTAPSKAKIPTREERLAAKLRENLRRRKAQAREMTDSGEETLPKTGSES